MVAINALEEAYKRMLKRKQIMEGVSGRVVSGSKALDALTDSIRAEFSRDASPSIDVFISGEEQPIYLFQNIIEHCCKELDKREIEAVIDILTFKKRVMSKERNFPPIYAEMLSDLIEVQRKRYSKRVKDAEFQRNSAISWIAVYLPDVEDYVSLHIPIISHCAKALSERELEETIEILSRKAKVMSKRCNFPEIYDEMLTELKDTLEERYR